MSQEGVRSKYGRRDGNQCNQLPLHWPSDTNTSDPGPIYQYPLDAHQATSCHNACVLPAAQPRSQALTQQPRLSVLDTLHQFVHGSSNSKSKYHASARVPATSSTSTAESIKAVCTPVHSAPATVPISTEAAVAAFATATKPETQTASTATSVSNKPAVTWPAPLMTNTPTVDSSWPRHQRQQPAATPATTGQHADATTQISRAHTRSSELVISEPETADYRQDSVLLKMLCSNAIVIGDGCGDWENSDDEHDVSNGLPARVESHSITLPPTRNSCPATLLSGEHDSGSYPLMKSWNSDDQLISSGTQNTSGPLATLLHSSIPEMENSSPGPQSDLNVKIPAPRAKTVLVGGKAVDLPQTLTFNSPSMYHAGPNSNSNANNAQTKDSPNNNAGTYTAPPRTTYWRHNGPGPRRGSVSATLLVSSMQDLMSIAEGDEEEEGSQEPNSSQTF